MSYPTCGHLKEDGIFCNSAAVIAQNYCTYHLRHRARLMRIAQARARSQRFDLKLPPLESMHAVQSALTQLAEALAADMIDLKRADKLLVLLRLASRNLLKSDKWPASIAHSDQQGPAQSVDLAAEYGLPPDLDLNLPPEVAFPPPPATAASETGNWQPATDHCPSPMPTVDYCQHGPGCPEHTIRADYPETPELAELHEIQETQGMDAAVERYKQQQRNRHRRHIVTDRKRYAAIALEKNLRLAAERLAEQKLAERLSQETVSTKKPPASVPAAPQSGANCAEKSELSPTG